MSFWGKGVENKKQAYQLLINTTISQIVRETYTSRVRPEIEATNHPGAEKIDITGVRGFPIVAVFETK